VRGPRIVWFNQIPEYMKKRGMNCTHPPHSQKKLTRKRVDEVDRFLSV